MDDFETFARKVCEYCMKNFVIPYMKEHGVVQSYRAQVISVDAQAKTMVIQRPFDQQITIPYADSAKGLKSGDQCVVFSLGDSLNSVVFSDGNLNT